MVDGGSTDGTAGIARKAGARVIESARGRGTQLERGALAASGAILLFLHADSRLPSGWSVAAGLALSDGSIAAGAFTLSIDAPGRAYRLVELGSGLRSRLFSLPYGDQAVFTTRENFEMAAGELGEMPLMEDVYLIKRLKKFGRIVTLGERVTTSPRMWLRRGVLVTTLRNLLLVTLFSLGVSPKKLYSLYYK